MLVLGTWLQKRKDGSKTQNDINVLWLSTKIFSYKLIYHFSFPSSESSLASLDEPRLLKFLIVHQGGSQSILESVRSSLQENIVRRGELRGEKGY